MQFQMYYIIIVTMVKITLWLKFNIMPHIKTAFIYNELSLSIKFLYLFIKMNSFLISF